MKYVTLTYKLSPEEDGGYSVVCLDWDSVYTQGETIAECRRNATEVTEMMLDLMNSGGLDKSILPKIKSHKAHPLHFQLTFDLVQAKFISVSSLRKKRIFQ